jgi:hypothetical protein
MVGFRIVEIPGEIARDMKRTGVWQESCPVAIDRLALLEVTYCDFNGVEREDGRLIVFDAAAAHLAKLFKRLHAMRFPIAQIRLMHEYGGDDCAAIADNNTSCFNQRLVAGQELISLHSYGLALDINPMQNPCLTANDDTNTVVVQGSVKFLNRNVQHPGMIEPMVPLVCEAGFLHWGGTWRKPVDYQHFQFPRPCARLFQALSKGSAKQFFDAVVANPSLASLNDEQIDELLAQTRGQESLLLEKLLTSPSLF